MVIKTLWQEQYLFRSLHVVYSSEHALTDRLMQHQMQDGAAVLLDLSSVSRPPASLTLTR